MVQQRGEKEEYGLRADQHFDDAGRFLFRATQTGSKDDLTNAFTQFATGRQRYAIDNATKDAMIERESRMLLDASSLPGSKIDRRAVIGKIEDLRGAAAKTGDIDLVGRLDGEIKRLTKELLDSAEGWGQRAAREFGGQMSKITTEQVSKAARDLFSGKIRPQRGQDGQRVSYLSMMGRGVRGQVEGVAGNAVGEYVSHEIGTSAMLARARKSIGADGESLARHLHDYIASGGSKAGIAIAEGAASIYTAANALSAAFGKGGKKRKVGGLLGTIIGGVAGSFIGGPGGGWKLGSALGGQVGGMLGFAGGGRPPVGRRVLVGEKGPEVAEFDAPATIYTAARSRQMMQPVGAYQPSMPSLRSAGAAAGAAAGGGQGSGNGGGSGRDSNGAVLNLNYNHYGDNNNVRDRESVHNELADHLSDFLGRGGGR